MLHVTFHETASRKLLNFTLYVYPFMSNGVSYFNLLDKLITSSFLGGGGGGALFLVFFLNIQILANNSGEPDPTPPW